jgi:beta-lactam-binding protein with PASTA domain
VLNNDDGPPAVADIEVPNVIDMTEADALAAFRDKGFSPPDFVNVERADKAAGLVFEQNPAAGKLVKPSTPVILQISLGAGSDFPPNVVGISADEAEKTLTLRGFGVQRVPQSSIDVTEGLVISQDPTPDKQLQKGKPVLIRVSTGGQEITLPGNLVNRPIDEVLKQLTDLKLKVDQLREASETVEIDRVIKTDPASGKIKEGAHISVFVSDGQPKLEMPEVRGLTQDAANAQLTQKGLVVAIEMQTLPPDDARVGTVLAQSVAAGQQVRKNQTVRLTIGRATATTTTTSTTRPTTTTR